METKSKILVLPALLLASSMSHAVIVTCYPNWAPNQVGCYVFLHSHEVLNLHPLVYSSAEHTGSTYIYDFNVKPKPTSTVTPAAHWHTTRFTYDGDQLCTFAVQGAWPEGGQGAFIMDHDTQGFDCTHVSAP